MDEPNQSLAAIEQKAARDPIFTDGERDTLREMIRVYRGWQFVLKVLKGGTVVLTLTAGAIVAISTIVKGASWLPW